MDRIYGIKHSDFEIGLPLIRTSCFMYIDNPLGLFPGAINVIGFYAYEKYKDPTDYFDVYPYKTINHIKVNQDNVQVI